MCVCTVDKRLLCEKKEEDEAKTLLLMVMMMMKMKKKERKAERKEKKGHENQTETINCLNKPQSHFYSVHSCVHL